jgi:hypothetical protein
LQNLAYCCLKCNSPLSSNTPLRTLPLLSHRISVCSRGFMRRLSRFSYRSLNILEWNGLCLIKLTIIIASCTTFFYSVSKNIWSQHLSVNKTVCCDVRIFLLQEGETSNGASYWWGTANSNAYTVLPRHILFPDMKKRY